ncbi:MAG TPA: alanine--glyoxylate aminotransferase family protein [Candidatus Odoribacter faecigallinarum]|uniref:Alanine--glyoxylate aminotransferase family protein n=1 Tax=Candidatus Odoribacter faecigallinarum TaxID=2838706 RepID=A0A9D1UY02_9BACT|nr:alanine--glyoxylate aminotransferase family protein [Candidatus Odoribacter faecigallinarum]
MKTYKIPMVPGPTSVSHEVLEAGMVNFGSADLERDYVDLYVETGKMLGKIMQTEHTVVIQTGEGMLALWGALKSSLRAGDRVLVLSTGLFGYGMGEMAESLGCKVRIVEFGFDETLHDYALIEAAIRDFQPKMITMVQNETPSGTMNPVEEVGRLKEKYGVPLLYVDAVSGIGGSVVKADEWHVDFCLGGSQKCLSAPASMAFLSVSPRAWEIIGEVGYAGYDALLPYRTAVEQSYFPYTPYWQGTAQLHRACRLLLEEGLEKVIARHEKVAEYCRKRVQEMGLRLYPAAGAVPSPTVTAVYVPEGMTWADLDARLRDRGVVMGGNYGCLAGKVFRIGHMGTQANLNLVKEALDVLEETLHG